MENPLIPEIAISPISTGDDFANIPVPKVPDSDFSDLSQYSPVTMDIVTKARGEGIPNEAKLRAESAARWSSVLPQDDGALKASAYDVPIGEVYTRLNSGKYVSKYDNYIAGTNNEDRFAQNQSGFRQLNYGIGKFGLKTVLNVLDATVGSVNGLVQLATEGRVSALWDNDFARFIDDQNKRLDNALPNYYTEEQKKQGVLRSVGTVNFLANDFLGGMSFLVGTMGSEAAWAYATGGASLLTAGARVGVKASARLGLKGLASTQKKILNAYQRSIKSGRVAGGVNNARFLYTSAGYEAGVEARHSLDESMENFTQSYMAKHNRPPSADEYSTFLKAAVPANNIVFAANMALVGGSNVGMLGGMFGVGTSLNKGIQDGVSDAFGFGIKRVMTEGGAKWVRKEPSKMARRLYGATLVGTPLVREGIIEEGGQSVLSGTSKEWLGSRYNADAHKKNLSLIDSFGKSLSHTYGTKEGHKEILLGMLIGAVGSTMSPGFDNKRRFLERGRIKAMDAQFDTYADEMTQQEALFTEAQKSMVERLVDTNRMDTYLASSGKKFEQGDHTGATVDFDRAQFAKMQIERKAGMLDDSVANMEHVLRNIPDNNLFGENSAMTPEQKAQYKANLVRDYKNNAKLYNQATEAAMGLAVKNGNKKKLPKVLQEEFEGELALNIYLGAKSDARANDIGKSIERVSRGVGGFASAYKMYTDLSQEEQSMSKEAHDLKEELDVMEREFGIAQAEVSALATNQGDVDAKAKVDKLNEVRGKADTLRTSLLEKRAKLEELQARLADPFMLKGKDNQLEQGVSLVDGIEPITTESADNMYTTLVKMDAYRKELRHRGQNDTADALDNLIAEFVTNLEAAKSFRSTYRDMADSRYDLSSYGGAIREMMVDFSPKERSKRIPALEEKLAGKKKAQERAKIALRKAKADLRKAKKEGNSKAVSDAETVYEESVKDLQRIKDELQKVGDFNRTDEQQRLLGERDVAQEKVKTDKAAIAQAKKSPNPRIPQAQAVVAAAQKTYDKAKKEVREVSGELRILRNKTEQREDTPVENDKIEKYITNMGDKLSESDIFTIRMLHRLQGGKDRLEQTLPQSADTVSNTEWESFEKDGKVSDARKGVIARKEFENTPLSPRESEIKRKLDEVDPQDIAEIVDGLKREEGENPFKTREAVPVPVPVAEDTPEGKLRERLSNEINNNETTRGIDLEEITEEDLENITRIDQLEQERDEMEDGEDKEALSDDIDTLKGLQTPIGGMTPTDEETGQSLLGLLREWLGLKRMLKENTSDHTAHTVQPRAFKEGKMDDSSSIAQSYDKVMVSYSDKQARYEVHNISQMAFARALGLKPKKVRFANAEVSIPTGEGKFETVTIMGANSERTVYIPKELAEKLESLYGVRFSLLKHDLNLIPTSYAPLYVENELIDSDYVNEEVIHTEEIEKSKKGDALSFKVKWVGGDSRGGKFFRELLKEYRIAYNKNSKESTDATRDRLAKARKKLKDKMPIFAVNSGGNAISVLKSLANKNIKKNEKETLSRLEMLRELALATLLKESNNGKTPTGEFTLPVRGRVKQVYFGHPRLKLTGTGQDTKVVMHKVTKQTARSIKDVGYMQDGKIFLKEGEEANEYPFLTAYKRNHAKTMGNKRIPLVVVEYKGHLLYMPVSLVTERKDRVDEVESILGNGNLTPSQKATKINKMLLDENFDLNIHAVTSDNVLTKEVVEDLGEKFSNLTSHVDVESWIKSQENVGDIAQQDVLMLVDMANNPFHSPKLGIEYPNLTRTGGNGKIVKATPKAKKEEVVQKPEEATPPVEVEPVVVTPPAPVTTPSLVTTPSIVTQKPPQQQAIVFGDKSTPDSTFRIGGIQKNKILKRHLTETSTPQDAKFYTVDYYSEGRLEVGLVEGKVKPFNVKNTYISPYFIIEGVEPRMETHEVTKKAVFMRDRNGNFKLYSKGVLSPKRTAANNLDPITQAPQEGLEKIDENCKK